MSKSLARVRSALDAARVPYKLREMAEQTRTAEQAAEAASCALDQIVKSIIFRGEATGHIVLFLTAGGNRVNPARASLIAGQSLGRADATQVRAETGFAIGGVAPIGLISALPTFMDPRLLDFPLVWAAAGTPHHIFSIAPATLQQISAATVAEFTE